MSIRSRFVVGLVLLGLALRSYHYLRGPSMWHDEAAVAVNVLDKDYRGLLGPLRFHEAAPPLFLWVEKAATLACGDGVYSLRLPAFLASCAALLLVAWAAKRLLEAKAVPWSVLLFACSEQLSWHACEAKPYAFDVLAGAILLAVHAGLRDGPVWRQLVVCALLAPFLIFLSYPACFLFGGALAAWLPAVWRDRRVVSWGAYLLLTAAVAGSFLLLLRGPIRAQHDSEITSCWESFFPAWDRPWTVPLWLVCSFLDVFRYCCKPLGQLLAVLAAIGAVVLWRRGNRSLVVFLTVPFGLALAASFAHRYPFGGARIMVYTAPALLALIAAGAAPALDWLRQRSRIAAAGLVVVLLLPLWAAGHAVLFPWSRADTAGAAAYVEANRLPSDGVSGNDWTHLYYFRDLGAAFHWCEPAATESDERCWVVFTAETGDDDRARAARALAPPDWRLLKRREFTFTTVLLFARLSPRRGEVFVHTRPPGGVE